MTLITALFKEVRKLMDQLDIEDSSVSQWAQKSKTVSSIQRLPGDASTRRYYRVQSGAESYILMRMEVFTEHGDRLPFLRMQRHLHEAGVDVPRVLETDPEKGLILLEDLGDVTLLRQLQGVSSGDVERHWYERVIDGLVKLQVAASPALKPMPGFEPYQLRFDHEKLMWEVNFTFEHFYQGYLGRSIPTNDFQIMSQGFSEICTFLAEQPTVLTHRDFHSRNIMVPNPAEFRLVMIDFQDARMGPPQYDLASLLKDSYYQLEEAQVERLIDYYIARWEAMTNEAIDRAKFRKVFDFMSIQRNFKAIGSFASFLNKRGNPGYLKFIGNTFENIRRTLLKYPEYSDLREQLFHYYYF